MRFGQTGSPVRLRNIRVPGCFLDGSQDLVATDLTIWDGKIIERGGKDIEMEGAIVFPCFVDMHTHLDMSQSLPRLGEIDGSPTGKRDTLHRDQEKNWRASDLRARMEFSIKCAYAHGTRAMRTVLQSLPPQDEISWPVFVELQQDWKGKVDLQAVSMIASDEISNIALEYSETADIVSAAQGILGLAVKPSSTLDTQLLQFFAVAGARDLDVHFQCDDELQPAMDALRLIAQTVLEIGWDGRVCVHHPCSVSLKNLGKARDTLDLVAKAGIDILCTPNPANSGAASDTVTLFADVFRRGINFSFASGHARDPFSHVGDFDMCDTLRQATCNRNLTGDLGAWPLAFTTNPASACGFPLPSLLPGAEADLIIFKSRNWSELFSRPQNNRMVLRNGEMIDTSVPEYSELDAFVNAHAQLSNSFA